MSEEIKVKKIKKIAEIDTNEIKVKKVKKVKQIDQQCIKENENSVFCGIDFAKENTKDVSTYELNNKKSDCEKTDNFDFFIQPLNEVVPSVKKIKKVVENAEVVDIGEEISFTKVTDLDPKKYEDFTKEKFPYGAIFFDYEVFPYDWCVILTDVVNNKKTVIVNDRKNLVKFYYEHKDNLHYGYNNRNYDNTVHKGIILGMNPKTINDKIIVDGLKAFQISDKMKDVPFYAFDNYHLGHSLKQFESFLQMNIEETEVPFNLPRHLNEKEWEQTLFYNNHDVESTIEVFRKDPNTFNAHMGLLNMFKYLPFSDINKTSAQIVADILKCKKGNHDDSDQWNIVTPPNLQVKKYKHIIDWFFNPKNHDLKAEAEFDIMGLKHKIGYGGIHASIEKEFVGGGNIWHVDVQSYYPSLGIFAKVEGTDKTLFELAFGEEGAKIYKDIYDLRLKLKHEGKKKEQLPLKIVLNGTYGILRDKNSNAYYPRIATLISVFGQMYLVDLLEHLEEANCCRILNSNTDGLIIKCNSKEDVEKMNKVCSDWEQRSLMKLEKDEISYYISKDVNNYLFEFANGKIEVKGSYLKNTNDLDNDLPIVNECMREYIIRKINIEDYINNCDEFWKFMKTFKLSGDYKFTTHNDIKSTNKCYRVFASKDLKDGYLKKWKYEIGTILETVNSKGEITKRKYEGEKFAGQSDHVFIENGDIHGKKCSEYPKLDKQFYIDLVYNRLEDFGINARPNIFDF